MRRLLIAVVVAIPLVLFAACGREQVPLPVGLQRVVGTLERAPLSRIRRGTHLVRQEGLAVYFAESSVVNLGTLEGKTVELEGVLEYNTDPEALPVLVVEKILRGAEEATRTWSVPAVGMTIAVPMSWSAEFIANGATFTASGGTTPSLRVLRQTSDVLPFSFDDATATATSPTIQLTSVVVDRKRAVQALDTAGNRWSVHIDAGAVSETGAKKKILSLVFPLEADGDVEAQVKAFTRIVASVRLGVASSSARSGGATGSGGASGGAGAGKPCGGSAGILCPQGFYCAVTDLETGVGTCKKL